MSKERRMVKFYANNGKPFKAIKTDRNAPCKCGSGKKSKKCCGAETRIMVQTVPREIHYSELREQDIKNGLTLCDNCRLDRKTCHTTHVKFGDIPERDDIVGCEGFCHSNTSFVSVERKKVSVFGGDASACVRKTKRPIVKRVKCTDTTANLCDRCVKSLPTCNPLHLVFGNGVGGDNIIACEELEVLADDNLEGLAIDVMED